MNILFVLYGDFTTNSIIPLAIHARELHRRGHECAVVVPSEVGGSMHSGESALRALRYADVLADAESPFPDGRPADLLHAWTPRENVRAFVTSYMAMRPTPWVIYLEDNEDWIAKAALAMVGLREDVLLQHSEEVITAWTAEGLSHPLRYPSFIGLADAAVVIQDKLAAEVPPWVPCTTVMPGVDLGFFRADHDDASLKKRYGVGDDEHVIVYPGGLNDFTRPGLETLCRAAGLMNREGRRCRLLRSGPVALDFLERLPPEAAAAVTDLGPLPRGELPGLLALADVFVQPGKHDAFEDLRLPGKLPELLATGRPVVLPDTNIASLLHDGVDAILTRTGTAEEIADKCLALFADPERARRIGEAGRRFAETHFNPESQASRLEAVYRATMEAFDPSLAAKLWSGDARAAPVAALLARKLRLRAAAGGIPAIASAAMLETHARCIEFSLERERGLETGMAVRDREIAPLKEAAMVKATENAALRQGAADCEKRIAALEASLSWRLTAPLRMLGRILSRLRS